MSVQLVLCSECKDHEFQCAGKWCIPQKFICDGINNCGDNSDEVGPCGSLKVPFIDDSFHLFIESYIKALIMNFFCIL